MFDLIYVFLLVTIYWFSSLAFNCFIFRNVTPWEFRKEFNLPIFVSPITAGYNLGIGRWAFIILDSNQTVEQQRFILQHELGHFKYNHNLKGLIMSIIITVVLDYFYMGYFGYSLIFKLNNWSEEIEYFFVRYSSKVPAVLCIKLFDYMINYWFECSADDYCLANSSPEELEAGYRYFQDLMKSDNRTRFQILFDTHPLWIDRLKKIKNKLETHGVFVWDKSEFLTAGEFLDRSCK